MPKYNVGQVKFLGSFPRNPPKTGLPEVAFAGRSNVGKSSAINTLLGRKSAARVSRTPGRTRLINLFQVDKKLCFVDLPGYGFAKVREEMQQDWQIMIEGYLTERDALKLVITLVDASIPAQPMDAQLLFAMKQLGLKTLVLATKADRLSKSKRKPTCWKLAADLGLERGQLLPFSSTRREGIDDAWTHILDAIKG